jgi:hypothetical protein
VAGEAAWFGGAKRVAEPGCERSERRVLADARSVSARTPAFSCCRKRERSGRSGKEAVSPSPPPLRTARASFPACRSSRLTCRNAGRSEDPKAPALDCPLGLLPVGLVSGRVRRATVVRCRGWPYRADRVSHRLSFFSSDSTRGKSAPFQVGSLHPRGVALSL